MYILIYCFMIKSILAITKVPILRNLKYPVCINCVHFIEHTNNYPYDPLPDSREFGKCKMFGEIDLITGTIEYDYAKNCRETSKKCGTNASCYEEKAKF